LSIPFKAFSRIIGENIFDTAIEDLPAGSFLDRAWDVGNNPETAVLESRKSFLEFEIDEVIESKLLVSFVLETHLNIKPR